MITEPMMDKLHAMKLYGMAAALEERRRDAGIRNLSFEDRLAVLGRHRYLECEGLAFVTRLKYAGLRNFRHASKPPITALNSRVPALNPGTFRSIKSMLDTNQDKLPLPDDQQLTLPINDPNHVRGSAY